MGAELLCVRSRRLGQGGLRRALTFQGVCAWVCASLSLTPLAWGRELVPPPVLSRALEPSEARGYGGMVTADNADASEAGAQALREGGDAVDAAVVTALMLGVLQPFASGVGGGGFAVVYRPGGVRYTLDFREVAATSANPNMYLDAQGEVIPNASTIGARAAGIPGELAGLYELHRRHGRLPWKRLVAPALSAARDGFPMHALLRERALEARSWLTTHPTLGPALLTPSGEVKALGERVRFPELAWTLERVAEEGAEAFYRGEVAEAMVEAIKAGGGVISREDLARYAPKERAPLVGGYGPYTLLTMPPPSSGGAVLLQVLSALEAEAPMTPLPPPAAYDVPSTHRLIEALKHAFADRAHLMGDPDFVRVPVEQMLSPRRVAEVKARFDPTRTLPREAYGGRYGLPADGGTSHFNVIDSQGAAVALTTTINTSFGSRFVAGRSGVLLNNEMDDFVAKPGVPNAFGLIGRESNAITPGKRPLSSMTPTIVLEGRPGRDERVRGMVGASGGPTIITGTLQVFLNLAHGLGAAGRLGAAVSAPRVHHQWVPERLLCDRGFPDEAVLALRGLGHEVKVWDRFTAVQALWVYDGGEVASGRGALLVGSSDPTKRGRPAVVEGL